MSHFKKQVAFLFGAIAMISYVSIRYFPTQNMEDISVLAIQDEAVHMQVYLMDDSNTLVPLSIEVNEELQTEDKLQMLIAYMSGKQSIQGFYPLFQEDCQLLSTNIENGIVTMNFDDSFQNYQKDDELRILEAITWGATQFHEIEQVKISVNDEPLSSMPVANTPIPNVLNRSIGINHFETVTTSLHNSKEIVVYCAKKINNQEYMIPQSRRIASGSDEILSKVSQISDDVSVSSALIQPLSRENVNVESVNIENGVLNITLNDKILDSSQSVKQDIYDALVLSLCEMEGIDAVTLYVDDVMVSPNSEQIKSVSRYDLTYNEVKF